MHRVSLALFLATAGLADLAHAELPAADTLRVRPLPPHPPHPSLSPKAPPVPGGQSHAVDAVDTLRVLPIFPPPPPPPRDLKPAPGVADPTHGEASAPATIDALASPVPTSDAEDGTHRHTVYLDFDGGVLTHGANAAEDTSQCVGGQQVLHHPGFDGDAAKRLEIAELFAAAVAPYGIRVVHEARPPKHLPYSQVLFGGGPELFGVNPNASNHYCEVDCGDVYRRETSFAFGNQNYSSLVLAQSALNAVGRNWGLDYLGSDDMIMSPWALGQERTWAQECTLLYVTGVCDATHELYCGEGSHQQNDHAELLAAFGPDSPDTEAPTVTLHSPVDGATFAPGEKFVVEAEVDDNFGGFGWRLMLPEVDQELPAYAGETMWELSAPAGVYTIRVEALDHDGNVGFDEVTIHVGASEQPGDTTGDPTGDPEASTGEAPTTGEPADPGSSGESEASGDEPGSETAAAEDDDDAAGCACSQAGGGQAGALGLLGLVLLLGRRGRGSRK